MLTNALMCSSTNLEAASQADVLGRRADQNLEAAGFDDPLHVAIQEHEVLRTQREMNASFLSWFQGDAVETAENTVVIDDTGHLIDQVQLNDFVTGARAGIFHVKGDLD